MTDFYDDDEIVDLWTSEFLQEFNSCRPRSTATSASTPHVAFGRNTYIKDEKPGRVPILLRPQTVGNGRKERMSLHMSTKLSDSRIQLTNEYLTQIQSNWDKVKGTQMLNFKIDISKAREKRKRQLQYSREIRSGAKSLRAREIDSVTRLVVCNFRKLINCERCALFLMDDASNELFFKPVGDGDHSHARLKEIRFPASSGVAGWTASNKMMLNIKNAYHDARFNAEIDKKTGFRTRTILCHPVLSSTNQLLGVIQMINKKKGDEGRCKELCDRAKKKKSDKSHKGYTSAFEHFSVQDEEILAQCCSEVSKSLQEIFSQPDSQRDRKKSETKADDQTKVVVVSDEDVGISSLKGSTCENDSEMRDELSYEQLTDTDSLDFPENRCRRSSTARRSSVGQLAHFMKRKSVTDATQDQGYIAAADSRGITEAIQGFTFRPKTLCDKLQQRETERRQSNPGYLLAQNRRKRMTEYGQQNSIRQIYSEAKDVLRAEQLTDTDSMSIPGSLRPRSSLRRSSSMRRNSVDGRGIAEAIQDFTFRPKILSKKVLQRETERRQSNPDYLLAQIWRQRMAEYGQNSTLQINSETRIGCKQVHRCGRSSARRSSFCY